MIKIEIDGLEAILERETWTCESDEYLANMLNGSTQRRPFKYEPRPEMAIARFIVNKFKSKGAKITFDSERGKRSTRGEHPKDGWTYFD